MSKSKKELLLEVAAGGQPRPISNLLRTCTCRSSAAYDFDFDKKIRKMRPDWFASSADENKKKLLEVAKKGEPRPVIKKHPLGQALCSYTCKSSTAYDEVFAAEIRRRQPRWFADKAAEKKGGLLKMAQGDEPRPAAKKHPLGIPLNTYISKSHSSYDSAFDAEIRRLRPDWFKTDWSAAGRKAWATRRANEQHRKGSEAAIRGWETIRDKKVQGTIKEKTK